MIYETIYAFGTVQRSANHGPLAVCDSHSHFICDPRVKFIICKKMTNDGSIDWKLHIKTLFVCRCLVKVINLTVMITKLN